MSKLDWTHHKVRLSDIRKINRLYVLKIDAFTTPLFVKDAIFEERLKSYFLTDISNINRSLISSVLWNMYITKGYYVKINEFGEVEKYHNDPEKHYISYLEIDGPLGSFSSIHTTNKENLK